MKIVYPICCGVNVHKSFLVATIISVTKVQTLSYKKERFSTFNKDLRRLKDWLMENNCYDVCMESTGKYWVPVLNVLEPDLWVVIVNPKWVKAIKGNKDDVKDSKWIGGNCSVAVQHNRNNLSLVDILYIIEVTSHIWRFSYFQYVHPSVGKDTYLQGVQ